MKRSLIVIAILFINALALAQADYAPLAAQTFARKPTFLWCNNRHYMTVRGYPISTSSVLMAAFIRKYSNYSDKPFQGKTFIAAHPDSMDFFKGGDHVQLVGYDYKSKVCLIWLPDNTTYLYTVFDGLRQLN